MRASSTFYGFPKPTFPKVVAMKLLQLAGQDRRLDKDLNFETYSIYKQFPSICNGFCVMVSGSWWHLRQSRL